MLEQLKQESNRTVTENGAQTYVSTLSDCLDLFATIGALRRESDAQIVSRFIRAYAESREIALKTLFFARDVRGGLGERRVFRVILRRLAENEPGSVKKNLALIAHFGRFDDLLTLLGTPCENAMLGYIRLQLARDIAALETNGEVSLLAKWLPSQNASSPATVHMAKRVASAVGMSACAYRQTLSRLRARIRITENSLRQRDYTFDYGKQPSGAMFKYRKAFLRNDGERYNTFLSDVREGRAKLHTGTLTPYDVVAPFLSRQVSAQESAAIDVTWNALPDYTNNENAIAVVDGSGSMYGGRPPLPAAIALSLGIYFAERNRGEFHGHFITFSERPQLIAVKGSDIEEKLRYCCSFRECANTNLARVFGLILDAAVKHRVPAAEMPSRLYIISDMEFDDCAEDADMTNFESAKARFAAHGYRLPQVVFWNVAARNRQQPVTMNEQGVALVSGCSPRIFQLLAGGILTPYAFMMDTLGAERYAAIAA